MHGNKGPRPDQHNQGLPRHQDAQDNQNKGTEVNSNGQHSETGEPPNSNSSLTIDLQSFRKPGEKAYTQRSRLRTGALGSLGWSPEPWQRLLKQKLDDTPFRGRQIRVRFATHGAALSVKNIPQFVSNELLEEAFSIFGPIERAIVIVDDRGRPTGKGIVEYANKPAARKALDRCAEGAFLLTTFPRPVTVEPMEQFDEDEGLPEKTVSKNQHFHKEREQPPRFAHPGTFEYEYAMRWKALMEMEKQQYEQVDRNIKEAQEKLEAEMEAARHEHQVMLMRQDLLRRQEELRRMEELHSQEMQKRKQMELRQEEERRRREEEMRLHTEEMRRQQEGFKGAYAETREQDMRMHMAGAGMALSRTSTGGTPIPSATGSVPTESAPLTPGAGIAIPGQAAFPRGPPGPADFGPNKRRRF
ncbi:hypothetical protein GJAV_G00130860 [Gymnothorax javanicus]|nr:hypothetical protein GJAV_G00130860 [Gymnothorax javanicus]